MSTMDIFKMPSAMGITGRTSSITNAFVNSIIPRTEPTEEQVAECLRILGLNAENLKCAYCGDPYTEWDHLRPIVENKKPTGYISDIYNLVPSCGKCNQSKRNQYWKNWIVSDVPNSPKRRARSELDLKHLKLRIQKLEKYENWKNVTRIDFKSILGEELWSQHWKNCEKIHEMMKKAQKLAEQIRNKINSNYNG